MFKLKGDLKNKMKSALENEDLEGFCAALEEMNAGSEPDFDASVLAARGIRQLTQKEKEFYNGIIEAQRSGNVMAALTGIETVVPETVIDATFEDIEHDYPLLAKLDIKRVAAKVKVLFTTPDSNTATWSKLDAKITKEIEFGFEELDTTALKLSAYIPIPKAYLDLGPTFLDTITRSYLYEAVAKTLTSGVATNLVSNTGPVGMMADMEKGNTASGVTTYPQKTAIKVTEWTPAGLANVLKEMAKTRKGNDRPVEGLFLVTNPSDYFTLVKPAICVQNGSGDWVDRSPYAIDIVQCAGIPAGKAILGMDKMYVLGVASDQKGTIESSDEYQFLDDNRVYKIKLYANGQPKDNHAFQVLDISELKPAALFVTNVTTAATGA